MKTEKFCTTDIDRFLELANLENWVSERWELEFILDRFPAGSLALRNDAGEAIGFVTAFAHQKSGWIGNLIVAEEFRRCGAGEELFRSSMQALINAEIKTIWLTASSMGRSLYARNGFRSIDRVQRWVRGSSGSCSDTSTIPTKRCDDNLAVTMDAMAWGDKRRALIEKSSSRGICAMNTKGFAVLQPSVGSYQLGPFISSDQAAAEKLLDTLMFEAASGGKLFIDSPASNGSAARLLASYGFSIKGENELMYYGEAPDYRAEMVYGLATMGSCG